MTTVLHFTNFGNWFRVTKYKLPTQKIVIFTILERFPLDILLKQTKMDLYIYIINLWGKEQIRALFSDKFHCMAYLTYTLF